jgi:hypothetical protein
MIFRPQLEPQIAIAQHILELGKNFAMSVNQDAYFRRNVSWDRTASKMRSARRLSVQRSIDSGRSEYSNRYYRCSPHHPSIAQLQIHGSVGEPKARAIA